MSNGKIPSPEEFERQMTGGGVSIPSPEEFEQQMGGIPSPEEFERQMIGGGVSIPSPEEFERQVKEWTPVPFETSVPSFAEKAKQRAESTLAQEKVRKAKRLELYHDVPAKMFKQAMEAKALLSPKTPYVERELAEAERVYPYKEWPEEAKQKMRDVEETMFTEYLPLLPGGKTLEFLAPSRREGAEKARRERKEFHEKKLRRAREQAGLPPLTTEGPREIELSPEEKLKQKRQKAFMEKFTKYSKMARPRGGQIGRIVDYPPGDPRHIEIISGDPWAGFDEIFGAPFRFVAGGVKSAKDWLHYLMTPEGFYEKKPEPYWKTITESVLYRNPLYMGDVMKEALSTALARDLTPAESVASGLFGLFSEIYGPGQATRLLRLGRGGREATGIAARTEKALSGAGAKVLKRGGPKKSFWAGKMKPVPPEQTAIPLSEGPALSRWEITKAAETIAEEGAHPTRVAMALDYIEDAGKRMGLSPDKIHEARVSFLKFAGPEAKYMGKTGIGLRVPTTRKRVEKELLGEMKAAGIEAPSPAIAEKMAEAIPRDVPLGAKPAGAQALPFIGPKLGEVFYGASGAPGVAEAVRPWQAYRFREGADAIAAGKKLQDMMGSLKTEKLASNVIDLRHNLEKFEDAVAGLEHKMATATTPEKMAGITKEIGFLEDTLQAGFQRAGLTEAEVRAGFVAQTPEQKAAITAFEQGMRETYDVAKQVGLEPEYVRHYVYRTLTKEMRKLRREVLGGTGAKGIGHQEFLRGRQKLEKGGLAVSVAGTKGKEFVEPLASNYVARRQANALAISAKGAEDSLLHSYGREITQDVAQRFGFPSVEGLIGSKQYQFHLKTQGLKIHSGRFGGNRGKLYAIDSATSDFLTRMVEPKELSKVAKAWGKLHNWWKSQATVLRPGFVVRNVMFGNVWQLWQADVNLSWAMPMAFKAAIRSRMRSPLGVTRLQDDFLKGMDDLMTLETRGKGTIRPGMTLDDVVDMGRASGVEGGGFFGFELEEFGQRPAGVLESLRRGRQTGATPRQQVVTGIAKGLQSVNPVGSSNFLMRGNAWMNKFGEDVARWALYLDRMKKGYSSREALRDISKYIFNYNELSQFVQSGKQIFSFLTWNWKNAGLQISTLLNKPDKFLNFGRMFFGVQDLDVLNDDEKFVMQEANLPNTEVGRRIMRSFMMPNWAKQNISMALPWLRGKEEGGREFITTVGLIPMTSIQQMNPIELSDTIVSLMNPFIRRGLETIAGKSYEERASFWGAAPRGDPKQYRRVPGFIEMFLEKVQGTALYDAMTNWMPPVMDRHGNVIGHKWEADTQEAMQSLIPALGVLSRLTRRQQDQVYDTIISTLFGMKAYEMTERRKVEERIQQEKDRLEEMKQLRRRRRSLGYEIGSGL